MRKNVNSLIKHLVSVIIPAYNCAGTIAECINAVFSSQYDMIECIVVDDCSTDKSSQIVKSFPNVGFIQQKENLGCAAAKNAGAKLAKGDFLYFLDSDVIIFENTISLLVETALKYSVDMVVGRYSRRPMNDGLLHHYKAMSDYVLYTPKKYRAQVIFDGQIGGGGELFSSKAFNSLGGFNEKYKGASVEREELNLRFYRKGYHSIAYSKIKTRHYFPGMKNLIKSYILRIYDTVELIDGERNLPFTYISFEKSKCAPIAAGFILLLSITAITDITNFSWVIAPCVLFLFFNRDFIIETAYYHSIFTVITYLFIHFFISLLIFIAGAVSTIVVKLKKVNRCELLAFNKK